MNGMTLLGLPLLVFSLGMVATAHDARLPVLVGMFAFFAVVAALMVLDDLVLNERILRVLLNVSEEDVNRQLPRQPEG